MEGPLESRRAEKLGSEGSRTMNVSLFAVSSVSTMRPILINSGH